MSNFTTEQEFELIKFKQDIQKLSEREVKELLLQAFKDMMLQQNNFKAILKQHWGL